MLRKKKEDIHCIILSIEMSSEIRYAKRGTPSVYAPAVWYDFDTDVIWMRVGCEKHRIEAWMDDQFCHNVLRIHRHEFTRSTMKKQKEVIDLAIRMSRDLRHLRRCR